MRRGAIGERALPNSGTLSPNPWDLTLWGQNIWFTLEDTRTEDRAPQGCDPSAASSAGMAKGGFDVGAVLNSNPGPVGSKLIAGENWS
jgi:hypothetical protein